MAKRFVSKSGVNVTSLLYSREVNPAQNCCSTEKQIRRISAEQCSGWFVICLCCLGNVTAAKKHERDIAGAGRRGRRSRGTDNWKPKSLATADKQMLIT